MSLILVDQDGVIANWGKGYGAELDTFGSWADGIPRHQDQHSFNLLEGMDQYQVEVIQQAMSTMDYAALEPIEGAIAALHNMVEYGHDVIICTSPWLPNPTCVRDKIEWVKTHLGSEWTDRLVITTDKTLVHGDWLVDDKPNIHGRITDPHWKQIVFDQPYNQEVISQPRLMTWKDWDNVRFS